MGDIDKIKQLRKESPGDADRNSGFAQTTSNGWQVIAVKSRVDSFNQDALMDEIRSLVTEGCKNIALDLKNNRFISLPVIKYCVEIASQLRVRGGRFALVSCSEKTKRHFEIYGSLTHIKVVRSIIQLPVSRSLDEIENL